MDKAHYIQSIIYIVLLILAGFVVYVILNTLLNSDLARKLSDFFGDANDAFKSLMDGCKKQSDCETFGSKDDCKGGNGCAWGKEKTCKISTGKKPGEGGFYKPGCALGMSILIRYIAMGIMSLVGLLTLAFNSFRSTKTPADTVALATGETHAEVRKEMLDEIKDTLRDAEEKVEERRKKGDKLSKEAVDSYMNERMESAVIKVVEERLQTIDGEAKKSVQSLKRDTEQGIADLKESRSTKVQDQIDRIDATGTEPHDIEVHDMVAKYVLHDFMTH